MPSADATETEEATEEVATDEAREALLEAIKAELGDAVVGSHLVPGRDLWVRISNPAWADAADYLRNRQRFRFFDWLSAVDWFPSPYGRSLTADVDDRLTEPAANDEDAGGPADPVEIASSSYAGGVSRFQVLARVHSLATGIGINVKTDADTQLSVPSWVGVYPGASWHEREVFEMFGIEFDGHPDLRKLYLPGDFEGFPLRKDFPLLARIIKPWPGIVDVEPMPALPEEAPAVTPGGASTANPEDAS